MTLAISSAAVCEQTDRSSKAASGKTAGQPTQLTFLIHEGLRAKVAQILFQGNKNFSSEELASRMQGYLSSYDRFNGEYDAELFDVAIREVTSFVRSRGYLQARAGELRKETTDQGLAIIVPFQEGLLYRLGDIKIEGADHLAVEQIRAMLSLRKGDVANGELIGQWLFEDLKKVYGTMGFIQYIAEPVPQFKTVAESKAEGIVDFTVTIEEGRCFRIRSIKFAGNSLTKLDLRDLLLIREGDVYDHQLFEKSIQRLNEMGLFKSIDADKDTDFRTDEEVALLDIVIKVSKQP